MPFASLNCLVSRRESGTMRPRCTISHEVSEQLSLNTDAGLNTNTDSQRCARARVILLYNTPLDILHRLRRSTATFENNSQSNISI